MANERSEQVMTRMTPSEVAMLEQLASADGLYRTDVIRLLIRRAHAERFVAQPASKRKQNPGK
jgi:hypothetical protein